MAVASVGHPTRASSVSGYNNNAQESRADKVTKAAVIAGVVGGGIIGGYLNCVYSASASILSGAISESLSISAGLTKLMGLSTISESLSISPGFIKLMGLSISGFIGLIGGAIVGLGIVGILIVGCKKSYHSYKCKEFLSAIKTVKNQDQKKFLETKIKPLIINKSGRYKVSFNGDEVEINSNPSKDRYGFIISFDRNAIDIKPAGSSVLPKNSQYESIISQAKTICSSSIIGEYNGKTTIWFEDCWWSR